MKAWNRCKNWIELFLNFFDVLFLPGRGNWSVQYVQCPYDRVPKANFLVSLIFILFFFLFVRGEYQSPWIPREWSRSSRQVSAGHERHSLFMSHYHSMLFNTIAHAHIKTKYYNHENKNGENNFFYSFIQMALLWIKQSIRNKCFESLCISILLLSYLFICLCWYVDT